MHNNSHQVYLALGTNLGNRQQNMQLALTHIQQLVGSLQAMSPMYITQAVDFESDNHFLNAACLVQTTLSAMQILEKTQYIERLMGRTLKSVDQHYCDRIIDIDILFYDQQTHHSQHLTLPHPHLHQRMFVLAPLADIAPQMIHPRLNLSIEELKNRLQNQTKELIKRI